MNDELRAERSVLFEMMSLTRLDPADRSRIDRAIEEADRGFGFRVATSFLDDDEIIQGDPMSIVGARAALCPYTCFAYRNPEWLTWFDRDRWAEQLDAAVRTVAVSKPAAGLMEIAWHGGWVMATSDVAVEEIVPIVDAIAMTVQPPTRRSEVGRLEATGRFTETYRLLDPAPTVPATLSGVQAVEVKLRSIRFGQLLEYSSTVTVSDAPEFEWLGDLSMRVRPASRRGMLGDDVVLADRLAALLAPGAVLDWLRRSSSGGSAVIRFEGPKRLTEWFDDRPGLLAAVDALERHLPAAAVSGGLAYARACGILSATTEQGGSRDESFVKRRCPTGPWTTSLSTHSTARFDRPDGPPGRSMLLAWATVPGATGRTVIEATGSGVTVTEGGDASLTHQVVEQLAGLDHGPLGSRWFLDVGVLIGQVWWEVDAAGTQLTGLADSDISSLFRELNRLSSRTPDQHGDATTRT